MSSEPTRRTLLAGGALVATGSVLAGTSGTAMGQAASPASGTALSVKDFGAIGDGYLHLLSGRFSTLEEARRVFPFVTSLDQTLDWAAIQATVNAIEGRTDRRVHVPAGHYVISNSVKLPSGIDFFGDGVGVTIFDNEVIALKAPQIVNANPSFVRVTIRGMSFRGGTHALKIDVPQGEIAFLFLDNVYCSAQSDKNIECDRLLQSSNFHNCGFTYSVYGVFVAGHTTNAVNFYNCDFEQHSREHIYFRGAEEVNFYGGKFEAGGHLPNPSPEERSTLFLENAGAVNFHGVYFEGTHEILLKEFHSRGGVAFHGCHFTGAGTPKGLIPYRFLSDGLVTFGTNDWYLPSEGPARILLTGYNGQKLAATGGAVEILSHSPRQQRSVSGSRAVPAPGIVALVTIAKVGPAPVALLLTGELVLHGTVQPHADETALVSRRYHVRVAATGTTLAGRAEATSMLDDPGVDLTVQLRAGTIEAVLRGAAGATFQWSFDSLSTTAPDGTRLEAEVPSGA